MAYTKTEWNTKDPITKERMNHIETGIEDAHSDITAANTSISNLSSDISTANDNASTALDRANTALTTASGNTQNATNGNEAYTQLIRALAPQSTDQYSGTFESLTALINAIYVAMRAADGELGTQISNLAADVTTAYGAGPEGIGSAVTLYKVPGTAITNLSDKFTDITYKIGLQSNSITSIESNYTAMLAALNSATGTGFTSLSERLDAIDGGTGAYAAQSMSSQLTAVQSTLTTANTSNTNDVTYGSIDLRFEADEADINSRIKYTDIVDNLISVDTNKPLSANQGNVIYQMLGSGFSSSNTVASAISTTATNAQNYADTNKVDKDDIYNDLDYTSAGKVLDARQGKELYDLINGITGADGGTLTALAGRVSTAEGNITTLQSDVSGLTTDINTIATELDMVSNNTIVGTNSRIDSLETEVQNARGTAANLDSRLDDIESAISHEASGSDVGGLTERLSAVEATASAAATASDLTALTTRVSTLESEPQSATVVIEESRITYDAQSGVPTIYTTSAKTTAITPTTDADYLLENDGKYYYWKYIQTAADPATYEWALISGGGSDSGGGGGGGSSSGAFAATLAAIDDPDTNTDYFVGNNTIGYTHYRYVIDASTFEGAFVRILPKGLIADMEVTANGGLTAHTLEDTETNVLGSFVALKNVSYDVVQRNGVDTTVITFTDTNGTTHDVDVVGGGGSGASQTVRLNNALSSLNLIVPDKEGVVTTLRAKAIVKDGSEIDTSFSAALNVATQYTLDPTGTWTNFTTQQVQNNVEFSVDISSILRTGVKTYVRLVLTTVIEENTVTRTVVYEVSKVEMSIAAVNFNPAIVRTTDFNFAYRCMGSGLTKTIHFLIDGEDAVTPVVTTLHNDRAQQTIPVSGLTAGMHSFRVYFTVDEVESNVLNYYILYNNDASRVAPMIAIAAENDTITYGDDLQINYTVATVGTETTDSVTLELFTQETDGPEVLVTSTVLKDVTNETVRTWRPVDYPDSGTAYVRATATHTVDSVDYTDSKTIEITINALETVYTLAPAGEESLLYSYTTYGRSNNDAGKESYTYTYRAINGQDITWTTSFNNFNWSGDGYADGESLTISGGATLTANITPFQTTSGANTLENTEGVTDISQNGRTIEIEYEVQSATDLNDIIIDLMANKTSSTNDGVTAIGGVGLQATPQSCYLLRSGTTVNMDETGFILNESDIAAAYLTPGTRTHLAFVIEPWSDTLAYDGSYHQSVNIYVNGEFANACPYIRGTADFGSTATLRIGSASCIIKLYQIKVYNRGLTHSEILQNYKMAPATTRAKLIRFEDNDILNDDGKVDYEKARTKYNCLLLTGPDASVALTVSPYKGYPSPANRKNKKTGKIEKKTESGVTFTKPNSEVSQGYDVEFDLRDVIPVDQSVEVADYLGTRGRYVSSNNVQGTSSQKYPVHNLKVYLAKWQGPTTTTENVALEEGEEVPEGTETVEIEGITYKVVTTTTPGEIKKVKYSLKGKDENGDDIGYAESTLCWKADYMSTDHANTFNANIADGLFSDTLPGASWSSKHQNVIYGVRCLLFQKQGDSAPEFLGDGCLNNDKGNNKTYDLERSGDNGADTSSQKWEFTNNSDDLGYFKTDTLLRPIGEENPHIQALDAFESTYPDQGDLEDEGLTPNYNHLQVLLTWLSKRANYWDASTTSGTGGTYGGETYSTERELKKAIFRAEFEDHINMNHALTYYLFSEYIALCDNRVKNMFIRSDNVKAEVIKNTNGDTILSGNDEPSALWSNYVDSATGVTDETYIDWANSTFAVWAPVLYDLDSCFGVENVGYIRVRYDAGWDYEWNGAPQFNGYESRLWLQFADAFDSEIRAAALTLYNRTDGLNYSNFYRQQITGNLECISPALSNQDMLIKFDKPWSEGFINYALAEPAMETPYYKYLQRGSRTAQKTSFMNMRSKLLSSKYGADEFTNDSIKFRTGVPVGQSDLTDTKISVIANQVMYPGVAYGDNKDPTRTLTNGGKIAAGESCDIYATSPVQGNDGIFICGASILTDIGDISAFRPYQLDVGAGVNLKRLIVGSNAEGYTNGNTDVFQNLNKCVLLEEVNIQNCTSISELNLENNPLIKRVYAAGSGATTIIFPNGGVLTTVEYGANTGTIKLLNQSFLTTFSYEGNDYSSLTKLWVENTPNVPVVDIINSSIAQLTSGIRLAGIDVDLDSDPTFLQTITSDLAVGKYINSDGTMVAGNTDYPYISGKAHITAIRASLLAKVHELYPNLIVYNTIDGSGNVANNIITEYTITYQNYDGTVLYTDYRTGDEHYIDPVYDINPITGSAYISMPIKPDDVEYQYRFGTYTNNNYVRYSGWIFSGTTSTRPTASTYVSGATTFIAYYPTRTRQQYTVAWYEELADTTAIMTATASYGTDIGGYDWPEDIGAINRVKTVNGVKKVFKGWNRPVGKLTGNINVYALWDTSTIDNATSSIEMATLNAADLYALANIGETAKVNLLEDKLGVDPIFVQMGHDFDFTDGVTTYNLLGSADSIVLSGDDESEIKVYNGVGSMPEIKPLATNQDWTLALDYKFLVEQSQLADAGELVLMSCYQNANSSIQGFKLSLVKTYASTDETVHNIQISWGTQTVTIDYAGTVESYTSLNIPYCKTYRNIVVLRHNASDPTKLYVYYVAPDLNVTPANSSALTYGANFGTAVSSTTLTWANSTTIDTPLIIGGNYAGTTTTFESTNNSRYPAGGIIYWGKYWDADLGEKNCTALAAWPHETVAFYLCGYNNNASPSRQIVASSALNFVAAQGIGDRYVFLRPSYADNREVAGWNTSLTREFCNSMVYSAMPTSYQSILRQSAISAVAVDTSISTGNLSIPVSTDYIYLPAEREISTSATGYKASEVGSSWPSPWPWMQTQNVTNWYQQSGTGSVIVKATPSSIAPFLYRFSGDYIKPTNRIYNTGSNDPYGVEWTYNNTQIQIESGDVWIDQNETAYIYYTAEEIASKGIYVDKLHEEGGWKKAESWMLRTYNIDASSASEMWFEFIDDGGILLTSPSRTTAYGKPRLICPEFSI